MSGWVQIIIGV